MGRPIGRRQRRDTPSRAPVTVYPIHKGALENAQAVISVFEPEIEKGWMVKSDIPPFVPICARPMSVVDQKIKAVDGRLTVTGHRLVLGASFRNRSGKGAWY